MTEHHQEEQRGPDQEPRTGGVAVTRYISRIHDELRVARYDYTDNPPPDVRGEPGTWFPLAEDEAREAVIAAARSWADAEHGTSLARTQSLVAALARLDALDAS